MGAAMRYQPQGLARLNASNPIAAKSTAVFPFNGSFRSTASRSGNPVVTTGPTFTLGPNGYSALGNGAGKVVTDLLPSALGMRGAAPRSFVAEFDMPDSNVLANVFSFGDSSAGTRSMNALQINAGNFRLIRFDTFNNDLQYIPHTVGGTAARVFLAITYDGNVTVTFRSWSYIYSTKAVVFNTQTSTLAGPLATGNTAPLNLMGGGAYSFASLNSGLYFLALFGGSALSDAEILSIYQNRWQLFDAGSSGSAYQAAIASTASGITPPPSINGSLAATLSAPIMSATGLLVSAGTFAVSMAVPTFAASGTAATPPSGTFAASMLAPVMTSAGIALDAGQFSATMPAPTMAAIGTAAPNVTGTLAFTMPAPTMNAFGFLGANAPAAPVKPYRWRILRRGFAPS